MLPSLVPLSCLLRSVHRQSPAAQTQPAVQASGPISWRAPLLLQWLLHPSARMNLPRCETDLDPSLSRHGGLHVALGVAHSPCCTGASQALPRLARLPPQSPFSLLATDRHCEALLRLTAQPVHTVLPLPAASSPPPHPPLFFPARLGGAGTKPENGGGAEGSWEGDGGRGPTPAVHLGCFSPPEAPSPLLRRRPKAAWRSQRCGQRGQPHFNTQNKLIHSRGRQ